jgi:D-beta-D-heptose 7-phosphate kinase/D-beta-D-heptose 1-phosphate adenosyltransferase
MQHKKARKTAKKARDSALDSLDGLVTALQTQAVLTVGDIMLDRFVYGDVERISPESPVPVLSIRRESRMPGGAGNVLTNLAGLGVKAHIVAVTGRDVAAATLGKAVADLGIDPAGLIPCDDRPTTEKTRFLAGQQQLLRADYERAGSVDDRAAALVIKKAETLLPEVGALVLSDYGKGVLTPALISRLIAAARKFGIPVLVDPKGRDYSIYKGASLVTPNRKELAEATGGMPVKTDEEVVAAAQGLMRKTGIDAVLATRSQDGMSVIARKGKGFAPPVHLRAEALEVFDVSGAGDTVIATVAAALAAGADLVAAAALANIAGGIVVAKVGTAPVRAGELAEAVARKTLDITSREKDRLILDAARNARIADAEEAAECVRRWKARGMRVGFTNGCFDILHAGHVAYLNQARARCDRLIVGLNADSSVRRLKGPSRPVNNGAARAMVLAGLSAVDMVVMFGDDKRDDDKPVRLIAALQPDIFFKGGDYRIEQLPEAATVRAYGGAIEIMGLSEGFSTTATIERARKTGGRKTSSAGA